MLTSASGATALGELLRARSGRLTQCQRPIEEVAVLQRAVEQLREKLAAIHRLRVLQLGPLHGLRHVSLQRNVAIEELGQQLKIELPIAHTTKIAHHNDRSTRNSIFYKENTLRDPCQTDNQSINQKK